jgi:hypothetical protein
MRETVPFLLCQKLAREAEIRLKHSNDFDKAIAVSMVHDAVELLLWTACKEHDAGVTERSNISSIPRRSQSATADRSGDFLKRNRAPSFQTDVQPEHSALSSGCS